MSKRYKVVDGSQSGHCCFDVTIVDTTIPKIIAGEHWRNSDTGELEYQAVCECFEEKDAEVICAALNKTAPKPKKKACDVES
jgi:hypothetical protein